MKPCYYWTRIWQSKRGSDLLQNDIYIYMLTAIVSLFSVARRLFYPPRAYIPKIKQDSYHETLLASLHCCFSSTFSSPGLSTGIIKCSGFKYKKIQIIWLGGFQIQTSCAARWPPQYAPAPWVWLLTLKSVWESHVPKCWESMHLSSEDPDLYKYFQVSNRCFMLQ